jgi:predicted RNase H-like HicB family nuclease
MEKIIMIIEKSKDFFDAYSENCDGIYAAGESVDAVKADTLEAIRLIKKNLPEERWPKQIKGDYEIEWKFDVPSFLEYYSNFISLAGMERMTGINQKQLSNYLNHRSVPRAKQADRILSGIHRFARELLSITL